MSELHGKRHFLTTFRSEIKRHYNIFAGITILSRTKGDNRAISCCEKFWHCRCATEKTTFKFSVFIQSHYYERTTQLFCLPVYGFVELTFHTKCFNYQSAFFTC